MARKGLVERLKKGFEHRVKSYNRCKRCGRRHAYMRKFQVCRICFRELASTGQIPGVIKASW